MVLVSIELFSISGFDFRKLILRNFNFRIIALVINVYDKPDMLHLLHWNPSLITNYSVICPFCLMIMKIIKLLKSVSLHF